MTWKQSWSRCCVTHPRSVSYVQVFVTTALLCDSLNRLFDEDLRQFDHNTVKATANALPRNRHAA